MYFRLLFLLTLLHISLSDHPKLIIELFRHGARAPLSETDPYWAGRKGQLTKIGQAQHLVLGASLVHDYPHLKEVLENPSRMFLQSTQMNRTIESLKFHLWGMYHSDNITLDDLDIYDYMFYHKFQQHKAFDHFQANNRSEVMEFTPTRVHVTPLEDERELLVMEEFSCPDMEQQLQREAAEELDFIMSMIGHSIKFNTNTTLSPTQVYDIYDLYYANLYEGKHMEDKSVDSHTWNYLKHGAEFLVTHRQWSSDFLRKLYGMPLFEKILNLMEKSHEGDLPYDLVLLSAHDVTVFNLLSALNIVHSKCLISKLKGELVSQHCSYPNFASQLLIELWERDGQPKIRILYEKKVVNLCGSKDGECELSHIKDMFVKNLASLTLEEIFKHCGKPVCKSNSEDLTEGNPCQPAKRGDSH